LAAPTLRPAVNALYQTMFNEDHPKGRTAEKIAVKYLKERHGALKLFEMDGIEFAEFDMIAVFDKGKVKTIEVKADYKEKETGNIAIEYKHKGYFSGILVSQADWYIIVLTDLLLCVKKRDLFYFLRENEFREVSWNGDYSTIILVPTDELIAEGICDVYDYKEKKVKTEGKIISLDTPLNNFI
jgi:hypothetical protein